MMNSLYNGRKGWVDQSRGLLMCLVFLYHSEVFYGKEHLIAWVFSPIFLSGFFFISGYLFTSDWEKVNILQKWMQVLRVILIPYVIFMAAFLLPKLILLNYDWRVTLCDIFLLRASWFVIAIGVLQMLYAITIKTICNTLQFLLYSIVFTLIGYGFIVLYRDIPDWISLNPILHSSSMPGCLPACVNLAFMASPFFSLGILYRKYENKIRLSANLVWGIVVFLIYVVIVCLDHYTIHTSFTFASCSSSNYLLMIFYFTIAMSSLIMICKKVDTIKPLNYIGENTLLFYYFNILMLRVAGMFYNKFIVMANLTHYKENIGYGNYIIVTFLAIIGTFPIVWFINKYMPLLTGNKATFNKLSKKIGLNINW